MDRAKLEARLIQAEKRVALGNQHIARQRGFVLSLERLGNNADVARGLLEQFEAIQVMQIELRDQLLSEFEKRRARSSVQRDLGSQGSMGTPDSNDRQDSKQTRAKLGYSVSDIT